MPNQNATDFPFFRKNLLSVSVGGGGLTNFRVVLYYKGMKIDIQIPKPGTGAYLYTVAPALTPEEIAERDPAWYAPDALRYDDCLLIDDWDSDPRIAILDPNCDYETLELDEAVTKYRAILSDPTASMQERIKAHCILDLIVHHSWLDDPKIPADLRALLRKTAPELWPTDS